MRIAHFRPKVKLNSPPYAKIENRLAISAYKTYTIYVNFTNQLQKSIRKHFMEVKLSQNHKLYQTMLKNDQPVICVGSQGTGKTYGAVEEAVKRLKNREIKHIVISRPNVPFADTLGLLPGTDMEKLEPWIKPVKQLLTQFIPAFELEALEKAKVIDYLPFETIQGLTFDNSFVILDEAQNASFSQLKIFLGRQGVYSKTVLCGDVKQTSDLFSTSGLGELVSMINRVKVECNFIEFTLEDCVRSEQCYNWLKAFESWDSIQESANKKQPMYRVK